MKPLISSVICSPRAHLPMENIMDNYPSKRRKISPFTSILVKPSDVPADSEKIHDEVVPRLSSIPSTQAKLTRLDPNEVHPPAPFTESSQRQQNRSTPLTESKSLQESTNGVLCENKISSQHELRNNVEAERPTARAELSDSSVVAASGRNGIALDNGMLRRSPPEVNPHPTFSEKSRAAMAGELRASPPTLDVDKATSAPHLEKNRLKPAEQDQSEHVVNGTSTVVQHVREQEPLDGPEPELPFTPTKPSLDILEPRLPSTPSQLGLEPPPTPPKGLASAASPRRLRKKRQVVHKSSPLKPGDLNSTDKTNNIPYVSNLGPRVPVFSIGRSAQMFTLDAEHIKLQMERLGTGVSKNSGSIAATEVDSTEVFGQTPSLAERLALFLPFSRPVTSTQSSTISYVILPSDSLPDIRVKKSPEIQQAESLDYHFHSKSSIPTIDSPGHSLTQANSVVVAESLDPSRLLETASQSLEITFASYQQLLMVNIHLVIDKATGNSTNIKVMSISPWADLELGSWLRNEAQSLPRATIEQAIRNYWETSLIRASCWQRCEEDIGAIAYTEQPILNNSSKKEPEVGPNPPKKKPPGTPIGSPSSPVLESPRSPPEITTSSPPLPPTSTSFKLSSSPTGQSHSYSLVHPHLGRRFLLFTNPPVSLLISWHITIAADGTSHNHISAQPAFPKRWMEDNSTEQGQRRGQGREHRGEQEGGREWEQGREVSQGEREGEALGRIDEAFDALLTHRGVFESIEEICGRLFAME